MSCLGGDYGNENGYTDWWGELWNVVGEGLAIIFTTILVIIAGVFVLASSPIWLPFALIGWIARKF